MYKIGDLARKFHISRSAILYYDQLGLLKPAERAHNNYRIYGQAEVVKLERILFYRESGISLRDVQKLLEVENSGKTGILMERLNKIQMEIKNLKNQEKLVLDVLKEEVAMGNSIFSSSKAWTEMLVKLGYEKQDWLNWHREFERDNPEGHVHFLKNLNMEDDEIEHLLALIK
ncbi:MerR family transcriptional regulator [Anoxynatronum buryatiense]|uniref:Transcriptional regulator, MerR family n=1 Tax=Anoxynatronum buryatiense TaxID=489973 RepID=A0AA45WST3_9CLOT|nr:MerR family transcriptional regulator [Anoxynatronum buryatiense]SMP39262.1 transcriptional regulator, MerR family [Anoxynatronum buryatiense]